MITKRELRKLLIDNFFIEISYEEMFFGTASNAKNIFSISKNEMFVRKNKLMFHFNFNRKYSSFENPSICGDGYQLDTSNEMVFNYLLEVIKSEKNEINIINSLK